MSFKLKALGLSLIAALAMSSVAASAASAVGIHGEAATTHLTASSTDIILDLANGIPSTCKKMTIADGVTIGTATQEEVIVSPEFAECNTAGLTTHVNANGCKFTLKATSTILADGALVECPKPLTIVVTKTLNVVECTVSIGAQVPTTPTAHLAAGEKSSKKDITVTSTVAGITYSTAPEKGTVCGEKSALGKLTGSFTAFGFSDAAHTVATGITVA